MTKSVKAAAQAWNEQNTLAAVEAYQAGKEVAEIAKEMGKTVASVRSKLVSEKVYVSAAKATKSGATATRKLETVNGIETILSVEKGSLASLEKGTKAALEILANALVKLSEHQETE
jgi:hypothetical protein